MAPAQYPDCSGTRNLHDNLSDLRAQVAANQRGSQLVGELIDNYGLTVVQAYMGYIQVRRETRLRCVCVCVWGGGLGGVSREGYCSLCNSVRGGCVFFDHVTFHQELDSALELNACVCVWGNVRLSEQRRTGSQGHAERFCSSPAAADRLPRCGSGGFHGRRNTNQTAGPDQQGRGRWRRCTLTWLTVITLHFWFQASSVNVYDNE